MGNHQSASIQCCIVTDSEQETSALLLPGQRLMGYVRLTVHQDELKSFSGINLTVAGVEYDCSASVEQEDTDDAAPSSSSSKQTVVATPTKIVKIKYNIADFLHDDCEEVGGEKTDCVVKKGDYLYPFEIELPTPKSASADSNSNSSRYHNHHRRTSSLMSDITTLSSSYYSPLPPPGRKHLDSTDRSSSSSSTPWPSYDSMLTMIHDEPDETTMMDRTTTSCDQSSTATTTTTVVYKIRAGLRRKPGIALSVDTDIHCEAKYLPPTPPPPSVAVEATE